MCSVNFWHQQDYNSLFNGNIGHVTSYCKWPIEVADPFLAFFSETVFCPKFDGFQFIKFKLFQFFFGRKIFFNVGRVAINSLLL